MLQHLSIQNYAIIEALEIDFAKGMNIITGETGAGKSIIIGALNLILGARADSSLLVNKDKKSVIEGHFNIEGNKWLKEFILNNDLDEQPVLTVRREITPNGKSRTFINDTPVNLSQLQEVSEVLVDLHQQFDTLSIAENSFQINVIDALAVEPNILTAYKKAFLKWKQTEKKLIQLQEEQLHFEKESDYNRFQYDELQSLNLQENELENIESELKMLSHAEGIKSALGQVYQTLAEGEQPITQQLKSLSYLLNGYTDFHKELPEIYNRLQIAQIELSDIAEELDKLNDHIFYDAEKIEQLNERMSAGYKLQKKHGVQSTAELLIIQQQLQEKLDAVLNIGENIQRLEEEVSIQHKETLDLGEKISKARKKQIPVFEKNVNRMLEQVGMPNAKLQVSITPQTATESGIDAIAFMFDANKSGQFKPVNKVASGGELSRLMLCIKSLVAQKMDLPTLIFDEIDTGISGEAAKQVGIIMKTLAANRQIICITHQPQIAGRADAHFFVYKEMIGQKVKTGIKQLNKEDRIHTIAKMLGGEKPTAAAIENAKEMIEH